MTDEPVRNTSGAKECILCGKCLEVCPMVRATGREELSPKAKHYLAHMLRENPDRLKGESVSRLAALCMACGRCADACSRGLSGADAMAALRSEHPDLEQWLWKNWIRAGWLLWPTLTSLSRFAPEKLGRQGSSRLADAVRKLRALDEEQALAPWLAVDTWDAHGDGESVVVFPGCTALNSRTDWTDAAFTMLDGLGYDVNLAPDWTCCGDTLGHAGVLDTQAAMRRRNVEQWREADRPRIVTFCASCLHGLRGYAEAEPEAPARRIGWEPGEAEAWLAALTPLSSLWGATTFAVGENAPDAVLYHSPCHSRVGGHTDEDLAWLSRSLGDRLKGANTDRCCGMGGILQLGAPQLSATVAGQCWDALRNVPAIPAEPNENTEDVAKNQLLTGCSGCVMQLRATAPADFRVGHWLEILA